VLVLEGAISRSCNNWNYCSIFGREYCSNFEIFSSKELKAWQDFVTG